MVFSLGSWCMEVEARGSRKIILDCRNNFLGPRIIKTVEYLIWGGGEDSIILRTS